MEYLTRRARTSVVEAHWRTSSKTNHKNVRICTYTSVWIDARKHPSWGPPIDKDSAHHAHPLRTALSSRLRGAVVTVPASHGLGMACTFHFFKIGGRTGAGKWLGLGWGRAIKPAFGVETFVVIYAIEVMNIVNNFFEILLGPACYIMFFTPRVRI